MMLLFLEACDYETCSQDPNDCMSDLYRPIYVSNAFSSLEQCLPYQELQNATAKHYEYEKRPIFALILRQHGLENSFEVQETITFVEGDETSQDIAGEMNEGDERVHLSLVRAKQILLLLRVSYLWSKIILLLTMRHGVR